ncbi:MAG: transcriptional repressor [Proteobacteria bacterium]|nr:transcriptional repressor [Pseudomonadota bacterium]MBU1389554.1 transcriptional repressor [Pseudomonadota bacterium]MBU1544418.1 transcriptional repressor [Pseudomonadota bacterium]MBU2480692.1 transcriptional repressor [Pseudomonadota bacterium]
MCDQCNYKELLKSVSITPTENRLRVLKIIGNNNFPLSALDIFKTLDRTASINRVTVYRILDLFVARCLVDRISTGGRASYYGLAPNANHKAHPHFYCTSCGQMDCLSPETISIQMNEFSKNFPGRIDKFEMRMDGICKNCLKKSQK